MVLHKIYISKICARVEGFTLFEVLIVISLLTVIASMTLVFSVNQYKNELLSAEQSSLLLLLQTSRANSMVNKNQTEHGVAIDPTGYTGYVLFEGDDYEGSDEDRRVYIPRNDNFTFATSTPAYITFAQLSGDANYEGEILLINFSNNSSTIFVNYEGTLY